MKRQAATSVGTVKCGVVLFTGVVEPAKRIFVCIQVDTGSVVENSYALGTMNFVLENLHLNAARIGVETIPYELRNGLPRLETFEMLLDAFGVDLRCANDLDVFHLNVLAVLRL